MEENTNVGSVENTETSTEKTYSESEVMALLQQETDRRVTSALKKQEEKFNNKLKESEKLARMNESEKFQYELEQREKAIIEKERQLALSENKNEASKILSEKGISLELVDFVVSDTAEDMKVNIDNLERAFKASVKAEVEKRLASSTPKKNFVDSDTLTREKFKKLSLIEQQKLINENPDLVRTIYNK